MKSLFVAVLLTLSSQAHALTSCVNADGTFSLNIYNSVPIKLLVTDTTVSAAPFSYTCEKTQISNDEEILVGYGCVGGTIGKSMKVAAYINVTKGIGNYVDLIDARGDKSGLTCTVK